MTGSPGALEGDPTATLALEPAFARIGTRCFPLAAEHKPLYHAGAVFASNFLPVLQDLAQQLWRDSGVPADIAARLNTTLLRNVVNNILTLGPAARGDSALVQRQGEAVAQWNATAGQAYQALSQLAATWIAAWPAALLCACFKRLRPRFIDA